jgi:hypothetical protein
MRFILAKIVHIHDVLPGVNFARPGPEGVNPGPAGLPDDLPRRLIVVAGQSGAHRGFVFFKHDADNLL